MFSVRVCVCTFMVTIELSKSHAAEYFRDLLMACRPSM